MRDFVEFATRAPTLYAYKEDVKMYFKAIIGSKKLICEDVDINTYKCS